MVAAPVPVPAAGEATPPQDPPPSRVYVRSSSSSSSRRRCALSSRFREPACPRRHAWVSLQGRLVGAEEAASADAVAPGLSSDEAMAWELFSPLHRVLLVATVAAASSRSHAARRIEQLQRSIHLRDEVLQNMQQKLDDLFGEMNSLQQQYVKCDSFISTDKEKSEVVSSNKLIDEEGARCRSCSQLMTAATPYKTKDFCGTDDAKSDAPDRSSVNLVDHEERRMSDLSDFWSVVSSVENHVNGDNQLSLLAAEQELYNIQKECEEKDAVIKELTAAAHISSNADAKRIAELQDILKRKNMVISKLKKDMSALKQMVVELTRSKRASSVNLNTACSELPVMSSNILYDMSSTSPSSSDSESPVTPKEHLSVQPSKGTPGDCESRGTSRVSVSKTSLPPAKSSGCNQRSTIPLKEKSLNPKVETSLAGRQKQLIPSNGDFKKIRRQSYPDSRNKATKRWM